MLIPRTRDIDTCPFAPMSLRCLKIIKTIEILYLLNTPDKAVGGKFDVPVFLQRWPHVRAGRWGGIFGWKFWTFSLCKLSLSPAPSLSIIGCTYLPPISSDHALWWVGPLCNQTHSWAVSAMHLDDGGWLHHLKFICFTRLFSKSALVPCFDYHIKFPLQHICGTQETFQIISSTNPEMVSKYREANNIICTTCFVKRILVIIPSVLHMCMTKFWD